MVLRLIKLPLLDIALSNRQIDNIEDHIYMIDIMSILRWLLREEIKIHFGGIPPETARTMKVVLAKLYKFHPTARSYLTQTLTESELDVVLSLRSSGSKWRGLR